MRKPDFEQLLLVLNNEEPNRPTLFELYLNDCLYNRLAGRVPPPKNDYLGRSKWIADAFHHAGYDYATVKLRDVFYFPKAHRKLRQSVSLNEGFSIKDWESFEKYQWPNAYKINFDYLHELEAYIPNSMKVIIAIVGVQENLIDIIGFNNLCYMLFDNPEIIKATVDRIGRELVKVYQRILEYPIVGSVICSDDWGFKTQTMFSPEIMSKYIFPWHQKIVDLSHQEGRPAILHSCGDLSRVMNDVINLGYDAKHSYEDEIQPVEEAYDMYGDKIAILGGIDVGFMCRETTDEITQRCQAMLERAKEKGGYALGTGNSVPEYLPDEKYFAMLSAVTKNR